MALSAHSLNLDQTTDGWDFPGCACGWTGPPCPDKEIAAEFFAVHVLTAASEAEAQHIRQLEDACLILWRELPTEQALLLREEAPRLMDFLAHLHDSIEHEQAMVRQNVWAEPEEGRS